MANSPAERIWARFSLRTFLWAVAVAAVAVALATHLGWWGVLASVLVVPTITRTLVLLKIFQCDSRLAKLGYSAAALLQSLLAVSGAATGALTVLWLLAEIALVLGGLFERARFHLEVVAFASLAPLSVGCYFWLLKATWPSRRHP